MPADIFFSGFLDESFNLTNVLALSGTVYAPSSDATVVIPSVLAASLQNTFKFRTDHYTSTITDSANVKYYVDSSAWSGISTPATSELNASLDLPTQKALTKNYLPGSLYYNDNTISDDFLTHMAITLLGTSGSSNLFTTESATQTDIKTLTEGIAINIKNAIDLIGVSSTDTDLQGTAPYKYLTDSVTTKKNIGRELLNQLLNHSASKTRFGSGSFSGYQVSGDTTLYRMPLETGDSISYILTIKPSASQSDLQGVAFSGTHGHRKYLIKLVLA